MVPGDRVGYARAWLQSVTGGDPTNELWFARGRVVDSKLFGGDLDPVRFVCVLWDGETRVSRVARCNVAVSGSFGFAHADAKGWTGHGPAGASKNYSLWQGGDKCD